MPITDANQLRTTVRKAVADVKLTDVHTHLYPPCFGDLLLWNTLFRQNSPVSESNRGVLTVLGKLGLDPASRDFTANAPDHNLRSPR
jgi:hypothetical protein